MVGSRRWASLLLIWSSWVSVGASGTVRSAGIARKEAAHRVAEIGPLQRQRDVRLEPAGLVAAVEAPSVEAQAVERLPADHPCHAVGELDLAARAAFLARQMLEDLGQQHVAADEDRKSTRLNSSH